jgi:hypothetical protein
MTAPPFRVCSVPKAELDAAQLHVADLQTKLAAAVQATKERRGELTPRPAWGKLRRGGFHSKNATADQAAELCATTDRLSAELDVLREECAQARVTLAEMTERLREAECLLLPDVGVMPQEAAAIEEVPAASGREPDRFKVGPSSTRPGGSGTGRLLPSLESVEKKAKAGSHCLRVGERAAALRAALGCSAVSAARATMYAAQQTRRAACGQTSRPRPLSWVVCRCWAVARSCPAVCAARWRRCARSTCTPRCSCRP